MNTFLQSRIGQIVQSLTAQLKSRLGKWSIVVDFLDRVADFGFGKHCCANLIVRCVRE